MEHHQGRGERFERGAAEAGPASGTSRPGSGVTVVELWTFGVERGASMDLTGWSVEATDGKIGKVDDATYEAGGSYLVVDTGPWIFGKKVMLPAGVVDRLDSESESVFVGRTKDEIKNAPEYDHKAGHRDEDYRRRLGDYYGSRGRAGVL